MESHSELAFDFEDLKKELVSVKMKNN